MPPSWFDGPTTNECRRERLLALAQYPRRVPAFWALGQRRAYLVAAAAASAVLATVGTVDAAGLFSQPLQSTSSTDSSKTPALVAQATPTPTTPSPSLAPTPSPTSSVSTTSTAPTTASVSTATPTPLASTAAPSPTASSATRSSTTSGGGNALPWILLGVVAAVVVLGLIVAAVQRQRSIARARARALQQVIVAAHQLADAAMAIPGGNDPAAVTVWWRLVEAHQATLVAALAALEQLPPNDRVAPALADIGRTHDALRAAVATDRNLRIGAPAPTDEQLAYSAATIRERANAQRNSADALEALILPKAVR